MIFFIHGSNSLIALNSGWVVALQVALRKMVIHYPLYRFLLLDMPMQDPGPSAFCIVLYVFIVVLVVSSFWIQKLKVHAVFQWVIAFLIPLYYEKAFRGICSIVRKTVRGFQTLYRSMNSWNISPSGGWALAAAWGLLLLLFLLVLTTVGLIRAACGRVWPQGINGTWDCSARVHYLGFVVQED